MKMESYMMMILIILFILVLLTVLKSMMKTQETFVASISNAKTSPTARGIRGPMLVAAGNELHTDTLDPESIASRLNDGVVVDGQPGVVLPSTYRDSENDLAKYYSQNAEVISKYNPNPTKLNDEVNSQLSQIASEANANLSLWRRTGFGPKGIEMADSPFSAIGITDGIPDGAERGSRGKYQLTSQIDIVPTYNINSERIMRDLSKSNYNAKSAMKAKREMDEFVGDSMNNVGSFKLNPVVSNEGVENNSNLMFTASGDSLKSE